MNIKKKTVVYPDNLQSDQTILMAQSSDSSTLDDESQLDYPQSADELDHELDEALKNSYQEELDQLVCPRHPPELQCPKTSEMCTNHQQVFDKCFDKEEHTKYVENHRNYLKSKKELENLLHIVSSEECQM